MGKSEIVYLGLGSNLGEAEKNIINGLRYLKMSKLELLKLSSLYYTEPVGKEDQPYFYNMVVKASTNYSPDELLKVIKEIEKALGRVWTEKWGPRIIDIDILFYGSKIVNKENLIIPHPELHKRDFVLIPMAEIEPNFLHPVFNKTIEELLEQPHERKEVKWFKFIEAI
jgi:2-amino-4-hydroxy-6-hydroxymethyldihydropteridine diphosphokinase